MRLWDRVTEFIVRALDASGLVFEDSEARTLDEAMTVLEQGIAQQIDDGGIVSTAVVRRNES